MEPNRCKSELNDLTSVIVAPILSDIATGVFTNLQKNVLMVLHFDLLLEHSQLATIFPESKTL